MTEPVALRKTTKLTDLDAEQAVLGAALFDNAMLELPDAQLQPEFFAEPVHQRIFTVARDLVQAGRSADPITVHGRLLSDPALESLGALGYLLDLVDKAPTNKTAAEYIPIIHELWQRRELIRIGRSIIDDAGTEPPAQVIEQSEKQLLAIQVSNRGDHLVTAAEAVASVVNQLDNPEAGSGVKIGLSPLDDVTGGFMAGEMWIVCGRPGMGKSAVASSAALHVARHGRAPSGRPLGVIEISCEMTVEQMMRRHIADLGYELHGSQAPNYSAIRKRSLSPEQRLVFNEATAEVRALRTLRSVYRTGLTVSAVRSLARRQKAAWDREGIDLGLVIVDHVGLIRPSYGIQKRSEAQGEVARDTKELAGSLTCPILSLVQLNRQVEARDNKRPLLSDLRDSGEWEENADGCVGCYREAYYAQNEREPKGHEQKLLWDERRTSKTVEAIVLKIREGEMQTVKLWADMGRNAVRGFLPEIAPRLNFPLDGSDFE